VVEVARRWRRLHNEELHNLYTSSDIVMVIKSRRKGGVGYVAHVGRREVHTIFWLENLKGREHLEDLSIDGRIILTGS
jgi:hypothetical protein